LEIVKTNGEWVQDKPEIKLLYETPRIAFGTHSSNLPFFVFIAKALALLFLAKCSFLKTVTSTRRT